MTTIVIACFTVALTIKRTNAVSSNGKRKKTPTTNAREAPTSTTTRALRGFVVYLATHHTTNTGSLTQVSCFKAGGKTPTKPSLNI